MIRSAFFSLLAATTLLVQCAEAPEATMVKSGEPMQESAISGDHVHVLDTSASKIDWIGTKITGQHHGSITFKSGQLAMQGQKILGGEFILDMDTLHVHDLEGEMKGKLEKHLRDTDFFEISKYPEGKLVITEVSPASDGQFNARGNLTLRGVTRSIAFPVTIETKNGMPAKVSGEFNINRQEWGIVYKGKPDDAIRDEVNIKPNLVFDPAQN